MIYKILLMIVEQVESNLYYIIKIFHVTVPIQLSFSNVHKVMLSYLKVKRKFLGGGCVPDGGDSDGCEPGGLRAFGVPGYELTDYRRKRTSRRINKTSFQATFTTLSFEIMTVVMKNF